jgi:hypothetical protein
MQFPAALQVPSVSQDAPLFTTHAPLVLQLRQAPLHPPWQQRPPWQTFELHWLALLQVAPGPFLASQRPCTQKPLVHWESLPHWSMQPLPLQPLSGAQERAPGAVHLPFWQVEAPVSLFAPELQLAPLHWVPLAYFAQAPLPSHLPLSPHMADPPSLHIPFGSAALAGVGLQVPRALGRAQV